MPEFHYIDAGTVLINSKAYELIREQGAAIPFSKEYFEEAPFEGGAPQLLTERITTWNKGGFKSYLDALMKDPKGEHSVSEYGLNTDTRWEDRLMPGPLLQAIDMNATVTALFRCEDPQNSSIPSIGFVAGGDVYCTYRPGVGPFKIFDGTGFNIIQGVQWQNEILLLDGSTRKIMRSGLGAESIQPTGAGATTQMTPSAGANWQCVDDYGAGGGADYVSETTAGQLDTYQFGNVTVPSDSLQYIGRSVGIVAYIARSATGGTNPVCRGVVRIGGVNYFTDPVTLDNTTSLTHYDFGLIASQSSTSGWLTNPATGDSWTSTDINNAEFGIELQTAPGAGEVRVFAVSVNVSRHTWVSDVSDPALADWLSVGPKRLFKTNTSTGEVVLKNIAPGLEVSDELQWGDEVVIPGKRHGNLFDYLNPLTAYQKTAIVATDKGIHAVDTDGSGIRVMERIEFALNMVPNDPWLYVTHDTGLDRWIPGLAQSVGLENERNNQSPVAGPIMCLAFLGRWVYAFISLFGAVNNYILVGREAKDSDNSPNPIIWDTLIETGEITTVESMITARLWDSSFFIPEQYLFWGGADGLNYFKIPVTGGAPEVDHDDYRFTLSGTRYTSRMKFNHEANKTFYKVKARGKNLTANVKWSLAYKIDDSGSWNTTDINGTTMDLVADTLYEFFLPLTAVGSHIQWRLTYTSNTSTAPGWIEFFEVYAIPHARRDALLGITLRLEDNIRHTESIEERSAIEQYNDLEALIDGQGGVDSRGPWGVPTLYPKGLKILQIEQSSDSSPIIYAQFIAQER